MQLVGTGPMPTAMPAVDKVEDESVGHRPGYNQLRAAAEAMSRGAIPSPEAFDEIGQDNMRWLAAMEPAMLRRVVQAGDEDLGRHMRGIRSIRGLLAYDRDSVDAYIEARTLEKNRSHDPERDPAPAYTM